MSEFVGFRLHHERDKDIIEDLKRYKDRTARMKEVYRIALDVEQSERYLTPQPIPVDVLNQLKELLQAESRLAVPDRPETSSPPKGEPLSWKNFPAEPTIPAPKKRKPKKANPSAIKSNILQGF